MHWHAHTSLTAEDPREILRQSRILGKTNRKTHFLNHLRRNRVECGPVLLERLPRARSIHLARGLEHRPTELHAPLDDARAVVADDPVQRRRNVLLRCFTAGILQGNLVEAEPDLGVGGRGEVVDAPESVDVCDWERSIGLESLEENDWELIRQGDHVVTLCTCLSGSS